MRRLTRQGGGDVVEDDQITSISGTVEGSIRAQGESLAIRSTARSEWQHEIQWPKTAGLSPREAKLASAVPEPKAGAPFGPTSRSWVLHLADHLVWCVDSAWHDSAFPDAAILH